MEKEAAKHCDKANNLRDKGDFSGARNLYEKALCDASEMKDKTNIFNNRAIMWIHQKQFLASLADSEMIRLDSVV